jgi:DNA-binding transcriptional ArsR family regulator
MPIHLDPNDGDETPPVEPGTNAHKLLEVLLDHPDMGFAPRELAELTDVPHASIHKTLSRLADKGLVRKVDSYWAIADDVGASRVGNLVSLAAIEAEYGDDVYGEDDGWEEGLPDLGENA